MREINRKVAEKLFTKIIIDEAKRIAIEVSNNPDSVKEITNLILARKLARQRISQLQV